MRQLGNIFILAGIIFLVLGILMAGGGLAWLGRLPGDIRITKQGFGFFFPLTTSIILSIVISLVVYLFRIFR
ncbi:MAG: DUF2905 domain-containing protein [Deltaproteobacteria bacterium]|nr:DUF2905 domain-containing protein [Deltaproteobacteria bacterium]